MSAAAELLRLQLRAAQGIISKMEIGTCRKMQDAIGKLWAGVLRDKVRFETVEGLPFPAEMAVPAGETEPKDGGVLYLHGGGYTAGGVEYARGFGSIMTEHTGYSTLCIEYRLAPEDPYPAALEDAVYAYRWLLEEKKYQPSQIVVAGDSAGGGLALALCLYAKDHGLPLPAGIITMSPWTDVSLSGASYEENYTIDPLFGNSKENMLYQCSYIGNANPKNPYLSPLFGDFEGFPPMLMQVGAYEVLLDDTRAAAKKARAEGVKVRCSVYDGMFHVFQMGLDLIPESREAWEEVAEYLRIIYRIHREPEGTVVKKVKTRRKETEDRARLNLLAFLKRELKK